MSRSRFFCLLVPALIGIALFIPVLQGEFVYDDRSLISLNPTMQCWSVVGKAFITPYWELVDASRFSSGFYRPLGAAVLGVTWQLGDGSPWAFHFVSLLLHAACAAAVTFLGLILGWRKSIAVVAGLFFATHGSHSEPVAWISAIPELLATLFSLLGLCAVLKRQALRAAVLLTAAMLCKEVAFGVWLLAMAITLLRPKLNATHTDAIANTSTPSKSEKLTAAKSPPPYRGDFSSRNFTLLWLCVAALFVYGLRVITFESAAAGFDRVNTFHALNSSEQFSLSFSLIGRYLAFLVWPWPHMPFRPLELGEAANTTRLWMALGGGAISLLALVAWLRMRSNLTLLFALGLLFAGLIPVMNTKALGQYPFEERFLYLPSAGFALLLAALVGRLPHRFWTWTVCALLLLPNAYSAYSGSKPWRSEESLFRWAREVSPTALTGHVEYGRLMLERAQNSNDDLQRSMYSQRAQDAYSASMDIDPDRYFLTTVERAKASLGMGDALYFEGNLDAAEKVYQGFLKRYEIYDEDPFGLLPIGKLGLANCKAKAAIDYGRNGNPEFAMAVMGDALALFEQALSGNPNLGAAVIGKASALLSLQRYDEALVWFEQALQKDPGIEVALFGKANSLLSLGRLDEALEFATGIFSAEPTNLEAALLLLDLQMQKNRTDLAIRTLEYFLENAPQHPQHAMVQQTVDELRKMQSAEPLVPPR